MGEPIGTAAPTSQPATTATPAAAAPAAATATTATQPATATAGPPTKRRKIQDIVDMDSELKLVLTACVGSKENHFSDGLLYETTVKSMKSLWDGLDFVKDGLLEKKDFACCRGVDPIWEELLDVCDFNSDGNITQTEFCAGFVFAALSKEMIFNGPPAGKTTGFEVLKSLAVVVNEHVMREVETVKKRMGW